jgi:hypothetical protein
VALSSFSDTTLQWPWVAPIDRLQPGPGCWRSKARLHPCNGASSLLYEQLSEGDEQPLLPPPHGALFARVAPITPCLGYRSVKQRFLSSPGCHLWQQAKSGESFPLMPTRSEQLSHLLVPPQEASLAATHPVGTGCDPTDKTAVASGSCIGKVLDARVSAQSMKADHIGYSLRCRRVLEERGLIQQCSQHNTLSSLNSRSVAKEGRSVHNGRAVGSQ